MLTDRKPDGSAQAWIHYLCRTFHVFSSFSSLPSVLQSKSEFPTLVPPWKSVRNTLAWCPWTNGCQPSAERDSASVYRVTAASQLVWVRAVPTGDEMEQVHKEGCVNTRVDIANLPCLLTVTWLSYESDQWTKGIWKVYSFHGFLWSYSPGVTHGELGFYPRVRDNLCLPIHNYKCISYFAVSITTAEWQCAMLIMSWSLESITLPNYGWAKMSFTVFPGT